MKDFSYVTSSHPAFIENLYQDFRKDPSSVDPEFKKFFEGFDFAITNVNGGNGKYSTATATAVAPAAEAIDWMREVRAYRMILGYRNKGHLIAKTNPIRKRKDRGANLDLGFFGFTEEDLDKEFNAGKLIGLGTTTLKNIIQHLEKWYAGHVGIEFKYISEQDRVDWLTHEL